MNQTAPANPIRQRIVYFFFSLVISLAVLMVFNSQLTRWYLIHWFEGKNVTLSVEELRLSLWDSELEINKLTATGDTKRQLSLGYFKVDWQWSGLLQGDVSVEQITIEKVRVDIVGDKFKPLHIGPLDLSLFSSEEQAQTAKEPSQWSVALGPVKINDVDVCYQDSSVKYADLALPVIEPISLLDSCLQWQSLSVDSQLTVNSEGRISFVGDTTLSGLKLTKVLSVEQLALKEVSFSDSQLNFSSFNMDKLKVNEHLALGQLALSQTNVDTKALAARVEQLSFADLAVSQQQIKFNLAKFRIDALKGDIDNVQVDNLSLSQLGATYQDNTIEVGQLRLDSVTSDKQQNLTLANLMIAKVKVNQQQHPLATLESLHLPQAYIETAKRNVVLTGLGLKDFSAWLQASDQQYRPALQFDELAITKSTVSPDKQTVEGLVITKIGLLQSLDKDNERMLVKLAAFNVNKADIAQVITVGEIKLDGLDSLLDYHPDSGLNVGHWFATTPEPELEGKASEDKTVVVPTEPPKFTIDSIVIGENSQLAFVEHTLDKPVTHLLSDIKLDVKSVALGQPADVDFSANIQNTGRVGTKGKVTLDPKALVVDLIGKLQYLPLVDYSMHSARNIGYRIEQGQLDIDFSVKLANDKIDSNFDVILRKFELGDLQQDEISQANNELGIPLPIALNLLRDGDDNIELSLPISGDLSNPDFSTAGIISTVAFKALKTAVLYTYSPLGMLSIAGGLVDLATALKFEPITFTPAQITLDDTGRARLDKIGQLLSQKPKVSLVLCGYGTFSDLSPEVAEQPITPQIRASLLELATKRQLAVQTYLVEEYNVVANRLLLCNVKMDKNNMATAKVELSI